MLLWGGRHTCENIPKGPGSKQRPRSDARLSRVLWQSRPPPLPPSPASAPHTPGAPRARGQSLQRPHLTVKCLVPQQAKGAKAWRTTGLEAAHAMVARGRIWCELATLCVPEVPKPAPVDCSYCRSEPLSSPLPPPPPHIPSPPHTRVASTALPDTSLLEKVTMAVIAESESLKVRTFQFLIFHSLWTRLSV